MAIDIEYFRKKLEEEKKKLEGELFSLGRQVAGNKNDWEATPSDLNIPDADKNETADRIEDFEERISTEKELEMRLLEITLALSNIEKGTYGLCEVDGEPIEELRLEANPGARTCLEHLK
ncbi:MAG: TraR/DksA C4-type zinc finger protein [Patescibacteria group bacterium]